jgi:hypothetical protein
MVIRLVHKFDYTFVFPCKNHIIMVGYLCPYCKLRFIIQWTHNIMNAILS